jgi:hypothetical protein
MSPLDNNRSAHTERQPVSQCSTGGVASHQLAEERTTQCKIWQNFAVYNPSTEMCLNRVGRRGATAWVRKMHPVCAAMRGVCRCQHEGAEPKHPEPGNPNLRCGPQCQQAWCIPLFCAGGLHLCHNRILSGYPSVPSFSGWFTCLPLHSWPVN